VKALDPAAWRRLATVYGPAVYRWARRAGLRGEDAADVTQEVFRVVATYSKRLQHGRPGNTFRGWLWTITRNKVRDFWRAHANHPAAIGGSDSQGMFLLVQNEESGSSSGPPADSLLRRATEIIRAEFEEGSWQAFWRVTIDGRSPADVAAELGVSANAVYLARSRILRRFRELLSGSEISSGDERVDRPDFE
jgi:RNA polymerase sigma-70 factor (ECF subfamily)